MRSLPRGRRLLKDPEMRDLGFHHSSPLRALGRACPLSGMCCSPSSCPERNLKASSLLSSLTDASGNNELSLCSLEHSKPPFWRQLGYYQSTWSSFLTTKTLWNQWDCLVSSWRHPRAHIQGMRTGLMGQGLAVSNCTGRSIPGGAPPENEWDPPKAEKERQNPKA